MKKNIYLILSFILFSCSGPQKNFDLTLLNGYWEISEVKFPNGKTKPYQVNTTVDYIQLDKLNGFLKKMNPDLNGKYQTSNNFAQFTLVEKEAQWAFHFTGDYGGVLRIIALDSKQYEVVNEQNISYLYNRYTPINITNE
jgi:hypothetical protein